MTYFQASERQKLKIKKINKAIDNCFYHDPEVENSDFLIIRKFKSNKSRRKFKKWYKSLCRVYKQLELK